MMRTAYNLRAADDDWGQAGTLLRDVDGRRRARTAGVQRGRPPPERGDGAGLGACLRVLENIDKQTGEKIEAAVRNGSS
jgi:catalase